MSSQANSQLNNSNEIIETIDDIQVQDDSNTKKPTQDPNKPQYDEEFGKEQVPQEKIEDPIEENNIAEPESSDPESEKETVDRKDMNKDNQESYEDELEKNANRNKLDEKDQSSEDLKNFEVDPTAKPPQTDPVVQEPTLTREEEILEEAKAIPENPAEQMPVVEEQEPGAPIEYAPEPIGPVIVYENEKKISDQERIDLSEKTKIEIEEDPYTDVQTTTQSRDYLKPFKERRPSWTFEFELGSSMYEPINYLTDINPYDDFETFYEGGDIPLTGIAFDIKKNFSWAAISFGTSVSYYSAAQDDATFDLTISSLRAILYLDTLYDEPYIVPYGTIGYSYMMFKEEDSIEIYEGATDNFYVGLGLLFQLDWLDPVSDTYAYTDTGIENTFIFAEARTYLDQGIIRAEEDADFSSTAHLAAGIKLEF